MADPELTSEQIRLEFLKFFEERAHTIVSSASLVPVDDPTLLFTNAGMNQFKDVFLGTGSRPYARAVNTQKCLRVSGKHNDLEEVGHDTYHHTFFEMLGNWSFGDYFKKEAILWAWELLVDTWGLEPDRLYATVHEGDESLGLEPDHEAAEYWKSETGLDPSHILYCSTNDNFWMMGDTGPCGPCSEVHVDLRSDVERRKQPGSSLVNADDPRVMEIWNLVFIQYNARKNNSLQALASRHVDTGMGFERMVAVLQGKTSNYDTDLFAPLLQCIADLSPLSRLKSYDEIRIDSAEERERIRVALRVIADHIRTIVFAVADGVTPGNVGRSYVIRRILRRAIRYGYQYLELKEPFLSQIVQPLVFKMGDQFPETARRQEYIERVIRAEEESFLGTLESGLIFFERVKPYIKRIPASGNGQDHAASDSIADRLASDSQTLGLLQKAYVGVPAADVVSRFSEDSAERIVPGEIAFLLHDTYGFPVDLTDLMAREEGLSVDTRRFDELMKEQKDRARKAASFRIDPSRAHAWQVVREGDVSVFTGHDTLEADNSRILRVRAAGTGAERQFQVVLDQTPFYAESGGQVGDTGILRIGDEEIRVLDTVGADDMAIHRVERLPDNLDLPVRAVVDADRRKRIMKHHTATHLMHAALREVLGAHVNQKGSLVAPDRLRFDFSHFEKVSMDELRTVERRVNEIIQSNIPKLEERDVPFSEAEKKGAMALFGEKYGDSVRIITFGPDYSVELCGGTHVDATGEIGLFRFINESSIASGIRRVEAVAGFDALEHIESELASLERTRSLFRSVDRPVEDVVEGVLEELRKLEKELTLQKEKAAVSQLDEILANSKDVNGIRIVTGRVEGVQMDTLQNMGEGLRERLGERAIAVLGAADLEANKAYLVACVSDDLVKKGTRAGDLVARLAKIVGGGGGGRPTLASAGGRKPEKLDEALAAVPQLINI